MAEGQSLLLGIAGDGLQTFSPLKPENRPLPGRRVTGVPHD
jgi:hypothetical protein